MAGGAEERGRNDEEEQRPAKRDEDQRRRDVGDQHVLEHVRREQVAVAEQVERRDERQHEDREPDARTARRGTTPHGRRARAAEAAGTPARSTRPRRRRAPARAARPSTATRGRAGSRRLESYFARSQHGRCSHALRQSPGTRRRSPRRLPRRDRRGDRPCTPQRHGLPRHVWGLSPTTPRCRAPSRRGARPSRDARGQSPRLARQTRVGTVPQRGATAMVAETRLGTVPSDMSRYGMSEGAVYGPPRRITATSEEASGSLLHQPSKGDAMTPQHSLRREIDSALGRRVRERDRPLDVAVSGSAGVALIQRARRLHGGRHATGRVRRRRHHLQIRERNLGSARRQLHLTPPTTAPPRLGGSAQATTNARTVTRRDRRRHRPRRARPSAGSEGRPKIHAGDRNLALINDRRHVPLHEDPQDGRARHLLGRVDRRGALGPHTGRDEILPLTDFGTVRFTSAAATSTAAIPARSPTPPGRRRDRA